MKPPTMEAPKWLLTLTNQLYEIESKLQRSGDAVNALRNVQKIKEALAEQQVFYEDPFGQPFKETRTDLDASITGEGTENLHVVEVIKPIVRLGTPEYSRVVQKGIVVVQSKALVGE